MKRETPTSEGRPPLCHARQAATVGGRGPRPPGESGSNGVDNFSGRGESKRLGAVFEAHALDFLRRQRLRLVARNVSCRGGEIDLVMRDRDGSLVFVEVRARAGGRYGGAAASIGAHKRRRILLAARYFLATRGEGASACRFDVVVFEGRRLIWLRDAFREDGS
ncbi:YraN family protein [Trinickia sp. Y13]|uniref:YraN family protein n=1 Tax=Trinickia sp. Y13 TaxID=2917807 RepID=UPI002404BDFD|nr:YraN family protein [Trinickia sp. Y13]MDG0027815.1 YraN family protein [Trinickia sp. Y13]